MLASLGTNPLDATTPRAKQGAHHPTDALLDLNNPERAPRDIHGSAWNCDGFRRRFRSPRVQFRAHMRMRPWPLSYCLSPIRHRHFALHLFSLSQRSTSDDAFEFA